MNRSLLTLILGFVIVLFVISVSSVSAASCSVTSRASCSSSGGVAIMGLSDQVNAHGQVWNTSSYGYSNYSYVLCCDYAGSLACTGTNTVVSLSSISNAHAEIPLGSNYNSDVCYEGLSCVSGSSCNSTYPISVLSLSSSTNAHLGNSSTYGTKICCQYNPSLFCGDGICSPGENSNSCSADCAPSLFWSANPNSGAINQANVSDTIYLKAIGTGLSQGTQVIFEVFENDPTFDDDIRTLSLGNAINGTVGLNGTVVVSMQITQNDWDKGYDGPTELTEEEFYFTVNGYTSPDMIVYDTQTIVQDCVEYVDESSCSNYAQSVADNTVNQIEGNGFCGSTVPVEGACFATTECRCEWKSNTSECSSSYSEVNDPVTCQGNEPVVEGTCVHTGSTQDSCSDGLISYVVNAEWAWTGTGLTQSEYDALSAGEQVDYVKDNNSQNWYYDPNKISLSCEPTQRTIPCPAQIQIPFFGKIQFLFTIISIVGIYLISFITRKNEN